MEHLASDDSGTLANGNGVSDRHLATLLRVIRAIGNITELDRLLAMIVREATAAFEADRSTLFVHDRKRQELWSRVAEGLEGTAGRELRIGDDQGLAGHVYQTGKPLLIPDTHQEARFDRRVAAAVGYVPRSMLVVPVTHRPGRIDGVLQVMDARTERFGKSELELASAIATQVSVSLDNVRLYSQQRRQFYSFVEALSTTLDARDPSTSQHSRSVANFAMGIAAKLGLDARQQEYLRIAGLLHDVGKIGTPEAILTKPDKLTDEEYAIMKDHAAHTRRILSRIRFSDEFADLAHVAHAHHEKLDGSGYPDGLTAKDLPLTVRILCVADIADALTQDRYYRPGMSPTKAMGIIADMAPNQLDADCVAALGRFLNLPVLGNGGG